jgi:hypothetical protein
VEVKYFSKHFSVLGEISNFG